MSSTTHHPPPGSLAEFLIAFYSDLTPPQNLPDDIQWLYPQKDAGVMRLVREFFYKYYSDDRPRRLLLGINPGRFGAGVTGINFTAPKQLKVNCGIDHDLKNQSELSAEFIYEMIEAYGGAQKFYSAFFIGSVCPLGFVQHGRNLNYYDDRKLLAAVEPFIVQNLQTLVDGNIDRSECISIGGEKNFKFLSSLNEKYQWFKKISALPHPRFIMQYRRKQKEQFIDQYIQLLAP